MRRVTISILMALALVACSKSEQTAPAEDQVPAEEQTNGQGTPVEPAPPPPPPEAAPPPMEAPMTEAPMTEAPATDDEFRSAPRANEIQAPPQPRSAPVTRSLRVTATPVIVEIDRTQERRPANGGSSVVLFSEGAANSYRNTVTCVNIWNLMDTATTQEIRVGVRKADDGTVEALRPLYWLNKAATPAAERSCGERMANYDFTRAKTIRDKYRLTNAGPYFVVARTDEQVAAIIDLTGRTDREVADLVRYFRDGFAFQNDIWDPARNDPAKKRALVAGFFGTRFRESLMASLGFISAPAARAGCRLGDLRDAPCT